MSETWAQPKWKILGLKGRYCPDCARSLRDFRLALYSIVPMCREDLHQFLHNGDMDRVRRMMELPKGDDMLDKFTSENKNDENGNPAGGMVRGTGLSIDWQDGPLGRGAERIPPNGAFVETVIAAAKQRIEYYQTAANGRFACRENAVAITKLDEALLWLNKRTQDREARAVEGTHVA